MNMTPERLKRRIEILESCPQSQERDALLATYRKNLAERDGFCCYIQRSLRDGTNHHPDCNHT